MPGPATERATAARYLQTSNAARNPPPAPGSCFIVGNCIGAGNQRAFFGYLLCLVAGQCLFIRLAASVLAHSGGGGSGVGAVWAARAAHPGLLLLLLSQAPALVMSSLLLGRMAFVAAANLTVNEWINRRRYLHLRHETAGFCNRCGFPHLSFEVEPVAF